MAVKISITTEYITLGQLLKLARIISYGGEEKSYLASHIVKIDGVQDQRRGRKIYPGSIVELEKETLEVCSSQG